MLPGGRLSSLLLAGSSVAVAMLSTTQAFTGDGTVYGLTDPSGGNCNFMAYPSYAKTKFAALNMAQWDDTMNCGRCAQVTCTDPQCVNAPQKSEVVYILDQCPGCEAGDLDLSPDVFTAITGMEYTRLKIEWEFVDCPVEGPIEYCLKTGSNEHWTAIQPTHPTVGVKSVRINGKPTTMVTSAYYFLLDGSSSSADAVDLSQLTITTTSINGEVVEDVLDFSGPSCVKSSSQFHGTSPANQVASGPTPTASPTTAPPTPSPTPSPTTAEPTPSPTVEMTTTAPPTPSPTPSPTTAAPTPSPTPEATSTTAPPTPSPTSSPTTAAPTPSPTPEATPTPTSSTPSPTPSPTTTALTPTPTPSGSSTPKPFETAALRESSNSTSSNNAGSRVSGSFDGLNSGSSTRGFNGKSNEAGVLNNGDTGSSWNNGSNAGEEQKESTQTQVAKAGATVVVSVLAVLGCLFLMVVFILVVLLKKKKLQQKMQQRKRDDREPEFRYSSEEDYHVNTAIDEHTAYSYIAATTPH